jgi:thiamine pyrophosphokinase
VFCTKPSSPAENGFFMSRAVIFVNGLLPDVGLASHLFRPDDVLLAANGGTRNALALGRIPSVIIGDLDSLTFDEKRRMEEENVRLIQSPVDKDQTDLELALHYAVEAGYREILLIGALGRRLDQTLGNLCLLTAPSLAGLDVRADDGLEEVFFVHSKCQIHGKPGDIVSLIPWGRKATGVLTEGLRWRLHGETLYPDKTRTISNEMLGETASVSLSSGLLLVVHRGK